MTRADIIRAAVEAARQKAIDPVLVAAVIEQESSDVVLHPEAVPAVNP